MSDNLKASNGGMVEVISEHLPGRTAEIHGSLSQDNRYFGPDFNMPHFKYVCKILP
jgi:hypothetical protein